jgi:hypothetical protein
MNAMLSNRQAAVRWCLHLAQPMAKTAYPGLKARDATQVYQIDLAGHATPGGLHERLWSHPR